MPITLRLGPDNELIFGGGTEWITESIHLIALLAASVAILWIQYSQRNVRLATVIAVIATVLAVCGPLLLTHRLVFGVQKLFSSTADEQKIVTKLASGCWGSDSTPMPANERIGPNPVSFTTTLEVTVPQGAHVLVGASRLSYIDSDGHVEGTLKPVLARAPFARPAPAPTRITGCYRKRRTKGSWLNMRTRSSPIP